MLMYQRAFLANLFGEGQTLIEEIKASPVYRENDQLASKLDALGLRLAEVQDVLKQSNQSNIECLSNGDAQAAAEIEAAIVHILSVIGTTSLR